MTFVAKTVKSAQIYNENFNHFFTEKLNNLTLKQREELPDDLVFKLYNSKNEVTAEKLSFNEKIWMLETVFGCDVVISVCDKEKGIDAADFKAAVSAQKGKINNGQLLEQMRTKSIFVLSGRELMKSLLYMAHVSCTGIYQLVKSKVYLPNADHAKNKKHVDERLAIEKTLGFIKHYEANKQRIASVYGLTMPEWYALVYFAIKEGYAIDFYDREFIYSYNSNKQNLHRAILRIHTIGYLTKRTQGKRDMYIISTKGMAHLIRIFDNLLFKF